MNQTPILEVRGVKKAFGGLIAVRDVSFHVSRGEILGFVGPNGAGKTTIFNLIAGIYRPDSGHILFDGAHIEGKKSYNVCKKGVARTWQLTSQFPNLTVLESIMVGCFLHTRNRKKSQSQALEVLDMINMSDLKNAPTRNLTLEKKKRVELGRALATNPKLLLLDELMAGLNPSELMEMIRLLERIREMGITLFLVEHIMRVVMEISERVIVLAQGQKIAEGSPREMGTDEKVIKAYLGKEYVFSRVKGS